MNTSLLALTVPALEAEEREVLSNEKLEDNTKNRSSIALRLVLALLPVLILYSGYAQAGFLRYDLTFNDEQLGNLLFDAQVGAGQNLWPSLVDWNLSWDGLLLNSSNSFADPNSLFFVDAFGSVTGNGIESIECVFPPGSPVCLPTLVVTNNPAFFGNDGSSIEFNRSAGSFSDLLWGDGGNDGSIAEFGTLIYSGPNVVPLPATIWLIGAALLGLGQIRHRKVFGAGVAH